MPAVAALMLGVEPALSLLFEVFRALHQHLFGFNEILSGRSGNGGMVTRVHPNRVAGAGLHTQTAVDAPERVDFKTKGKLLHRRIGMFPGLDQNARGRTGGGAEKASRAPNRSVVFQRESVTAAKGVWIDLPLLRILDGDGGGFVLGQPKSMKNVKAQVSPESEARNGKALQNFRQVKPLEKAHFRPSLHKDSITSVLQVVQALSFPDLTRAFVSLQGTRSTMCRFDRQSDPY
jgi:hypothetical protein